MYSSAQHFVVKLSNFFHTYKERASLNSLMITLHLTLVLHRTNMKLSVLFLLVAGLLVVVAPFARAQDDEGGDDEGGDDEGGDDEGGDDEGGDDEGGDDEGGDDEGGDDDGVDDPVFPGEGNAFVSFAVVKNYRLLTCPIQFCIVLYWFCLCHLAVLYCSMACHHRTV